MGLVETYEVVRQSIVAFASKRVRTQGDEPPLFPPILGTGFVVDSRGIVATNRHVADILHRLPPNPKTGAPSAIAILWGEVKPRGEGDSLATLFVEIKRYDWVTGYSSAGPYFGDPMPDIAFVQLDAVGLPALALAAEPYSQRTGMSVATAGFPLGTIPLVLHRKITQLTPILRHGVIGSLFPFPCPIPHGFTIDVLTQGGESGSPVFLVESPVVVGMVAAHIAEAPNITIGIPSNFIGAALAQYVEKTPLDFCGAPTLQALLEKAEAEASREPKWEKP